MHVSTTTHVQALSTGSLTDTQKAHIDERPADSKALGADKASKACADKKRGAATLQADAEEQQHIAVVSPLSQPVQHSLQCA